MKNVRFPRWRGIQLALLGLGFLLGGCTPETPLESTSSADPLLDKYEGLSALDSKTCTGEFPFLPEITVLDASDYEGFDLALKIMGDPMGLPGNCNCQQKIISLEFTMEIPEVIEAGFLATWAPYQPYEPIYETPGGFGDQFKVPKGYNQQFQIVNPVDPGPFELTYDAAMGNILLLDLVQPLPSGLDANAVIQQAGGICIIDNIDNPNG